MSSPETEIDATTDATEANEEKQKLQLELKIDSPSACERHVTVTISREDVDRYLNESYSELMPNATVPGFRAGRAPRKLVEHKFREQVSEQVKGSLLMDAMTQITDQQEFSAISEPDFDFEAVEIPEEGPLTFEFDIEVRPEFDVPKWQGLKLERLDRKFDRKDVDRGLEKLLQSESELATVDEPAKDGDYVVVNIKCRHEGKEIAEIEEETVRIRPVLSFRDARLEGFDKLMKGAKAGDKKKTEVTISHDAADGDLQGQTAELSFEVLEVKRLQLPELNEETLDDLGGFESEGELRDAVQQQLERQLEYRRQQRIRQQITGQLTEAAEWELPPSLLKRQARRELDRTMMELRAYGYPEEEVRAHENELRQNSMATTKTALQEHFILEKIAEDQKIEANPEDYDDEIERIAAQSQETPRSIRARLEKQGLMDTLRNQIIERKVIEMITKEAKFKDVPYEPEKNEVSAVSRSLCGGMDSAIPEAKHADTAASLQEPTDRG